MTGGGALSPTDTPTPTLGLRPSVVQPTSTRVPIPVNSSFFMTTSLISVSWLVAVCQIPVGIPLSESPAYEPLGEEQVECLHPRQEP